METLYRKANIYINLETFYLSHKRYIDWQTLYISTCKLVAVAALLVILSRAQGRNFALSEFSEFNLPSTNPNGNGGQTRHADKSDEPLCFADFVKLRRDDRGSQTKKSKKMPTKDEKVKVSIVSLHLLRLVLFSSQS